MCRQGLGARSAQLEVYPPGVCNSLLHAKAEATIAQVSAFAPVQQNGRMGMREGGTCMRTHSWSHPPSKTDILRLQIDEGTKATDWSEAS